MKKIKLALLGISLASSFTIVNAQTADEACLESCFIGCQQITSVLARNSCMANCNLRCVPKGDLR